MKYIFVVSAGWVLVGNKNASRTEKDTITIANAAVVRRWGTSKGLGQIALHGPQTETILDPCGEVVLSTHAVLMQIKCNEKVWPEQY